MARRFGVEVEAFNLSADRLASEMTAAGVECHVERYNHTSRSAWKIVGDGSIRGYNGFELVSPPLTADEAGFAQVRTALTVVQRLGAKVNRSCGLHVHVDCPERTDLTAMKRIMLAWVRYECLLHKMVAPSRRRNGFCKSNVKALSRLSNVGANERERAVNALLACSSVEEIRRALGHFDRYHQLNLESLTRHGTVEVRLHQGTTNPTKVLAWVKCCVGLVEGALGLPLEGNPHRPSRFTTLLDRFIPVAWQAEVKARYDAMRTREGRDEATVEAVPANRY